MNNEFENGRVNDTVQNGAPAAENTASDPVSVQNANGASADTPRERTSIPHTTIYTPPSNAGYAPPPPPPSGAAAVKQKKSHTGLIVGIVIAVCLLLMLVATVAAFTIGLLFSDFSLSDITGEETEQTVAPPFDNGGENDITVPVNPDVNLPSSSSGVEYSLTEAAAKTVNSVVEIRTNTMSVGSFFQQYVEEGAGSGVIMTEDGYIVTNNHVIDGADEITVILRNGTEYKAVLVGTDAKTDLAVVKIDASGLETAVFGDSNDLVVAETVIAIGNPLGELGGSVSNGIISALSRDIVVAGQQMTLLQTTAAVNPGNSGGGLFNMSGELIGIVNARSVGEDIFGIGFAIPAATAKPVVEDLIKYGYVRNRVALGITPVEILDSFTAMQYRVDKLGVYVYSVAKGSDAEAAGLKSADLLLTVNGVDITSSLDVSRAIADCKVGQTITVTVYRNGAEMDLSVTLTEYNPNDLSFDR